MKSRHPAKTHEQHLIDLWSLKLEAAQDHLNNLLAAAEGRELSEHDTAALNEAQNEARQARKMLDKFKNPAPERSAFPQVLEAHPPQPEPDKPIDPWREAQIIRRYWQRLLTQVQDEIAVLREKGKGAKVNYQLDALKLTRNHYRAQVAKAERLVWETCPDRKTAFLTEEQRRKRTSEPTLGYNVSRL